MAPLCSTGSAIIIHTASVLVFKGICYEQIFMRYSKFSCDIPAVTMPAYNSTGGTLGGGG